MSRPRIAIGGWQHETNTFATIPADLAAFERQDEWPAMGIGDTLIDQVRGVHLPVTGALGVLEKTGCEIVPLLWCSATPSAHVTEHAFETICARFLEKLADSGPLDGLYLDLHGAMVCEHLEDGEGEFLRRLRTVLGNDLPIAVSLDLHANVTPLMVEQSTVLDVFRTYPHVDMGETGARAARHLLSLVDDSETWHKAYRQLDFLLALNWGCTLTEPCRSIYQQLPDYIDGPVRSLSFASGFHLSDIHDVGPSVVGYGVDVEAVNRAVDAFAEGVLARTDDLYERFWKPDEAVAQALQTVQSRGGTVVLADTQDNPGGGGSGDTTGLLKALVAGGATNSALAIMSDRGTVQQAIDAGVGGRFNARLGGKSDIPGHHPWPVEVQVEKLTDGQLVGTGPMYRGASMALGPCARLRIGDVKVLVASKAVQTADQAMVRHFGLEPADLAVLALKSSVHFRNDFTDLASEILVVEAPGVVYGNPASLDYVNIRPGVRRL